MRLSRRTLLASLAMAGSSQAAIAAARELDTRFKSITCTAWSRDGKRIACASSDSEIGIWEWPAFRRVATLKGHLQHVRTLNWNLDGNRLVSAGFDSDALIWDSTTGQVLNRLLAPGGFAAWSPDGKRLATTYGNRALALWDDLGGPPTRVLLHREQPFVAAWSPDGKRLAAASADGQVLLWDTLTGLASPRRFLLTGAPRITPGWCRKGTAVLVPAATKSIDVLDAATGLIVRTLKDTQVSNIAVTIDGQRAALAVRNGPLRIWNVTDGQIENEIPVDVAGETGLAWHPSGTWLAISGSTGKVRFSESRNHEL